jgi:mRNA-degrading endonuclease RelE of RelBE toxin-antitoxin system
MASRKRRAPATTAEAVPAGTVRLAFSSEARAIFSRLPQKQQAGLRRKLREFGADPALGKPLTGALQGYQRVTLGRLRAIALHVIVRATEDGLIVVYVLHVDRRAEGSRSDPYVVATDAIRRGEEDALTLLDLIVRRLRQVGPDAIEDE